MPGPEVQPSPDRSNPPVKKAVGARAATRETTRVFLDGLGEALGSDTQAQSPSEHPVVGKPAEQAGEVHDMQPTKPTPPADPKPGRRRIA